MTSDTTTARIVGLAKLAGIDCDDVRLKQLKPGDPLGWTAELVHKGKDVENVDSELGLTTTQALDRLGHVVDALARGRLKVLAAKATQARAKESEAWRACRTASQAATDAALALNALDPTTAPTEMIETRLYASRAASEADRAAYARWKSLHRASDRASHDREQASDAYHALRSRV